MDIKLQEIHSRNALLDLKIAQMPCMFTLFCTHIDELYMHATCKEEHQVVSMQSTLNNKQRMGEYSLAQRAYLPYA